MGQHSVKTLPAKIRYHDSALSCDVQRTYAYRARCACGWEGPRRATHAEARTDSKGHRAHEVGGEALEATWGTETS